MAAPVSGSVAIPTVPLPIAQGGSGGAILNHLINGLLAIAPLAKVFKGKARQMMVDRAEAIGVPWRTMATQLREQAQGQGAIAEARSRLENPNLTYPSYYLTSFHAYDEGNLGWTPAVEVEAAARSVHAKIWGDTRLDGDDQLRRSYHDLVRDYLTAQGIEPTAIRTAVDLGCGVGMSTFALQDTFPEAQLTGVDLSPHFLAIADYNTHHSPMNRHQTRPHWVHGAAEATGLPTGQFDWVSVCLVFHELPQTAAIAVLQEARRLLKPGGTLSLMDMNPQSGAIAKMPPFVFTLLKSTEPYLDEYFCLDLPKAFTLAGFETPTVQFNTPRHRTLIARTGAAHGS